MSQPIPSRSRQSLIRLIIASIGFVACGVSLSSAQSPSAAAGDALSFGEPLVKPTSHFHKGDYGPITVVNKVWDETFDGRSRFRYDFLGQFDNPPSVKKFPQSISVYDGDKETQVFDWNSADCSLQKVLLVKGAHNEIFLLVATRASAAKPHSIFPQNEPAPQLIQLFRLIDNNGEKLGKPRAYFEKVADRKTVEAACTADEVYGLTRSQASLVISN